MTTVTDEWVWVVCNQKQTSVTKYNAINQSETHIYSDRICQDPAKTPPWPTCPDWEENKRSFHEPHHLMGRTWEGKKSKVKNNTGLSQCDHKAQLMTRVCIRVLNYISDQLVQLETSLHGAKPWIQADILYILGWEVTVEYGWFLKDHRFNNK